MKQWKVSFAYTERINNANISRQVDTAVMAATRYDAEKLIYAQYGRNIRIITIREM